MTSATHAAPKYRRIEAELRRRIRHGDYTDWLPPERQLATEFGATAVTARQALAQLQREGVITRRVGHGTRVNVRAVSPIRIHLSGQSVFHVAVQEHLRARFPEERLEFLAGDAEAVLGQCDLMVSPSTFLHDYESFFLPLPAGLAERLRQRPGLPARYLDIHRRHGAVYGVPFLVSATGLQVNETLAAAVGLALDRPLDIPSLRVLRDRLRRGRGLRLFDPQFVSTLALPHLIATRTPLETDEGDTDWRKALELALDDFAALFVGNGDGSEAFVRGRALFRLVCRQTVALAATQPPLPFPTRILPLFGGPFFPSYVCSESAMVSRDSAQPERLFQLAEAFLAPEVQNLVNQHEWGFPVVAEHTRDGQRPNLPGDDVLAKGLDRCIYLYPQVLRTLRPVLWALAADVLVGRLSAERLRHGVLSAYDAARLRSQSIRRYENRHAELTRLGAIA